MSEPEQKSSIAALSYATLDADGLPDSLPEVDALIDAGVPYKRIRKQFKSSRLCFRYLEKTFRRRFDPLDAPAECVVCGLPSPYLAKVLWVFSQMSAVDNFRLSDLKKPARVVSTHPLCVSCLEAWNHRVLWAARVAQAAAWLYWLALGAIVVRWIAQLKWLLELPFLPFIGALILSSVISISAARYIRRRAPSQIRQLAPMWMKCAGLVEYNTREIQVFAAMEGHPR